MNQQNHQGDYIDIRWQTGPASDPGSYPGAQVEDVLTVCLERLSYLRGLLPDRYTSLAMTSLEESIMWLDRRTADRVVRGVEGTNES